MKKYFKKKERQNLHALRRTADPRPNYEKYIFNKTEWILFLVKSGGLVCATGYLFYRSVLAVLLLSPCIILFYRESVEQQKKKCRQELNIQFKDGIVALSAALNAGYSIENAFGEALKDLCLIYGEDQMICREFRYLVNQLNVNVTVECLLEDLAFRSGLEDIKNFSEVFITAKRSGGDLMEIIQNTVQNIGEKIEVKREILTIMSSKQFEQKVMNFIPFGIILYVGIGSPEFLEPLYGNAAGAIIMSVCLVLYCFAIFLAKKIVSIEV